MQTFIHGRAECKIRFHFNFHYKHKLKDTQLNRQDHYDHDSKEKKASREPISPRSLELKSRFNSYELISSKPTNHIGLKELLKKMPRRSKNAAKHFLHENDTHL